MLIYLCFTKLVKILRLAGAIARLAMRLPVRPHVGLARLGGQEAIGKGLSSLVESGSISICLAVGLCLSAPSSMPRNCANLPDPMLRVVSRLLDRQNRLEERLRSMQKALPGPEAERLTAQMEREEEIREALRDVLDPEVGIDIVDLGLIKDIIIRGDDTVEVDMVLTTQACPMVSHLTEQVRRRVEGLHGIRQVEVKVLDEPWNWDHFVRQQKAKT